MKKSIFLLFAATGISSADAVTDISNSLEWTHSGTTSQADISQQVDNSQQLTVAISLNWGKIVQLEASNNEFFTISGPYSGSTAQSNGTKYVGTGLKVDYLYNYELGGYGGDNKKSYESVHTLKIENETLYSKNVEYATIVFTMNAPTNERAVYLQLWDKNMNLLFEDGSDSPSAPINQSSAVAISYNGTLVNDLHLYSGMLDSSEAAANIAYTMLTIPEPTTSTLCLLSVLGLAARRRR